MKGIGLMVTILNVSDILGSPLFSRHNQETKYAARMPENYANYTIGKELAEIDKGCWEQSILTVNWSNVIQMSQ